MQKNIYCVESENAEFEVTAGWFDGDAKKAAVDGVKKAANAVTKAGRGAANAAGRVYSNVQNQREAAAAETAAKKERRQDLDKAIANANKSQDGADAAVEDVIVVMQAREEECYEKILEAIKQRLKDQSQTKSDLREELFKNPNLQERILTQAKFIARIEEMNIFPKTDA